MKKIIALLTVVILSIFLYSCDYPEKSFNILNELEIPIEVTDDFILPEGVIGKFIWSSNNDAIIIDELNGIVTQTNEDVLVVLTATINKTSRSFEVLVLKIGSISVHDKAKMAHITLVDNYHTLSNVPMLMPNTLNDVFIDYNNSINSHYIKEEIDQDDNKYYYSNYKQFNEPSYIYVKYYKDMDHKILVYADELHFRVEPMDEDDIFILAFKELNINDYNYIDGSININHLKNGDFIEFNDDTSIDYSINYTLVEFTKISDSKIQLKRLNSGLNNKVASLTIRIDDMILTIYINIRII